MKEDILEQIVEDWFVSKPGFFVKHNLKYRPSKTHPAYDSKKDSVHSDIDILAFSGVSEGHRQIYAVTCKSWQGGFRISEWLPALEADAEYNERTLKFQRREHWKSFRELVSPKWQEAFVDRIEEETGSRRFTYMIAVTRCIGSEEQVLALKESAIILDRFSRIGAEVKLEILTFEQLIQDYALRVAKKDTPVLEATNIGRLLQLVDAAGMKIS